MTISEILKDNPLVLAPMAGITDLPFRLICRKMGAGLVFSEMISAEALVRNHKATISMLSSDPRERPVAFQLFGGSPETMAKAAEILSSRDIDFIDINMGCPVPKVVKSGAGSALLKDTGLIAEIMHAVVSVSRIPVTIKIRTGWDFGSIVAEEIARRAQAAGISAVTVHARTRGQLFSGKSDWTMIKRVRGAVSIPVIGNGDVRSAADAKRMIDETGCDGVMIGRASQGYPWIFREARAFLETGRTIQKPSSDEVKEVVLKHLAAAVQFYGAERGIKEMRKHICWYTKGMRGGAEFRARINTLTNADDVFAEMKGFFANAAF